MCVSPVRRRFMVSALFAAVCLASVVAHSEVGTAEFAVQRTAATHDGSPDFDFLTGRWKVHFKVLLTRLNGSNDNWVEYDGTQEFKKLFDTKVNFDEFDAYCAQLKMRNKGQTLKLYNTKTDQWSLYQLNNEAVLDRPVIGQFTGAGESFTVLWIMRPN